YVRSKPLRASDALGLYMWGGWSDTLATGAAVFALVHSALETHRFVYGEAADWATDWSRPDSEIEDLSAIAQAFHEQADSEVESIAGAYAPFIAKVEVLKLAQKAIKGFRFSRKVTAAFTRWFHKGPANVDVYMTRRNGKWYVGITNDLSRRGYEHGTDLTPLAKGLTRNQARALEAALIRRGGAKLDNMIQSVADDHRFAEWIVQWGDEMVKKLEKRRTIPF
ncbi:MAG: hypothetical protein KIT68_12605, partial [Phycisphaeraceae bacterium]|nr:hypothetical protein [Phycisphaeraceae bacterium]